MTGNHPDAERIERLRIETESTLHMKEMTMTKKINNVTNPAPITTVPAIDAATDTATPPTLTPEQVAKEKARLAAELDAQRTADAMAGLTVIQSAIDSDDADTIAARTLCFMAARSFKPIASKDQPRSNDADLLASVVKTCAPWSNGSEVCHATLARLVKAIEAVIVGGRKQFGSLADGSVITRDRAAAALLGNVVMSRKVDEIKEIRALTRSTL
jgi:hypothetical protein